MAPLIGMFGGGSNRNFGFGRRLIEPALYQFTSHQFTNAGITGRTGPTLAQCRTAYSSTTWANNNSFFNMTTQGYQLWTVPATGSYNIRANGSGHPSGAFGSYAQGTVGLIQGEILTIIVGQQGSSQGGSGGTFVFRGATPSGTNILIAGGGGGAPGSSNSYGSISRAHGRTTTNGGEGWAHPSGNNLYSGDGGTNGGGGGSGSASDNSSSGGGGGNGTDGNSNGSGSGNSGDGGAGILGNGGSVSGGGGLKLSQGMLGGSDSGQGGFGGGGGGQSGGGGGGGYSGGGGGAWNTDWSGANGGGGGLYFSSLLTSTSSELTNSTAAGSVSVVRL
jgi:hypothetical protein